MGNDPSFPWYASDWLGSQAHALLNAEQRAAYLDLLCHQWAAAECSLPDDDETLAKLSGMGEGWLKGGCQMVGHWFPPHPTQPGKIANPRLLKLRIERDSWIEKSRKGGRKSAAAKKKRRGKGGSTTVPTKVQPPGYSPSPSPSPYKPPTPFPPSAPNSSAPVDNTTTNRGGEGGGNLDMTTEGGPSWEDAVKALKSVGVRLARQLADEAASAGLLADQVLGIVEVYRLNALKLKLGPGAIVFRIRNGAWPADKVLSVEEAKQKAKYAGPGYLEQIDEQQRAHDADPTGARKAVKAAMEAVRATPPKAEGATDAD